VLLALLPPLHTFVLLALLPPLHTFVLLAMVSALQTFVHWLWRHCIPLCCLLDCTTQCFPRLPTTSAKPLSTDQVSVSSDVFATKFRTLTTCCAFLRVFLSGWLTTGFTNDTALIVSGAQVGIKVGARTLKRSHAHVITFASI
jgi:hypothetical protein